MVLPVPVKSRLERLEKTLGKLEEIAKIPETVFLEDWKSQDVALRNFQVAVEICGDIGAFILAFKNIPVPETYVGVVETLRKNGVFTTELEENLKQLVKFRNIIVHEYLDLDFRKVYRNLQNLGPFKKFKEYP